MKIYKYPIQLLPSQQVNMPAGAVILDIQKQKGEWVLWALVDPQYFNNPLTIEMYGTGQDYPHITADKHIATRQDDNGLVWHFFQQ